MDDLLAYDLVVGIEEPLSAQSLVPPSVPTSISSLPLVPKRVVGMNNDVNYTNPPLPSSSNGGVTTTFPSSSSSSSGTTNNNSVLSLPGVSNVPVVDKLKPSIIAPYSLSVVGSSSKVSGNGSSSSTGTLIYTSTTTRKANSFPSNLPVSHEYSDFTNVVTNISPHPTPENISSVPINSSTVSSLSSNILPVGTSVNSTLTSDKSNDANATVTELSSTEKKKKDEEEEEQQQQQQLIHDLRQQLLVEKERRSKLNLEILKLKDQLSYEEKSSIQFIAKLETEYETLKTTYHLHLEEMRITNALLEEKDKSLKNQERLIDDLKFQKDCLAGDISELHSQLKDAQETTVTIHTVLKDERKELGIMKEKFQIHEQRIKELTSEIDTYRSKEEQYQQQIQYARQMIQRYTDILESYNIPTKDYKSSDTMVTVPISPQKRSISSNTSVMNKDSTSSSSPMIPRSSMMMLNVSDLPSPKVSIAQLQQRKDALVEAENTLQENRNKIGALEADNLTLKAQYNAIVTTNERLTMELQNERNSREETEIRYAEEKASHQMDNAVRVSIDEQLQQTKIEMNDVTVRLALTESRLTVTMEELQRIQNNYNTEHQAKLELYDTNQRLQQNEKQYQESIQQKDEQIIALQAEVQNGRLHAQELRNDLDKAAAFGSALLQSNKDNQNEILKLRNSVMMMNNHHHHHHHQTVPQQPQQSVSSSPHPSSLLLSQYSATPASVITTPSTYPNTVGSTESVRTIPSSNNYPPRKPSDSLTTTNIFAHYAGLVSHNPAPALPQPYPNQSKQQSQNLSQHPRSLSVASSVTSTNSNSNLSVSHTPAPVTTTLPLSVSGGITSSTSSNIVPSNLNIPLQSYRNNSASGTPSVLLPLPSSSSSVTSRNNTSFVSNNVPPMDNNNTSRSNSSMVIVNNNNSLRSHLHDYDLLAAELNEAINTAFFNDIQQPMINAHLSYPSLHSSNIVGNNKNNPPVYATTNTSHSTNIQPHPSNTTSNPGKALTVTGPTIPYQNPSLYTNVTANTVGPLNGTGPSNTNAVQVPTVKPSIPRVDSKNDAIIEDDSTYVTAVLTTQALQDELQQESLARLAAEKEIEDLLQQLQNQSVVVE